MEIFKSKYLKACRDSKLKPNSQILKALEASEHLNQLTDEAAVLDFSNCNISANDCYTLSNSLTFDQYYEEYFFSDCLLTEEACQILVDGLNFNKVLKVLSLKGNNLRSAGANLVGQLLKRSSTIEELSLEWNTLGMFDTGLSAIAEGLSVNQSLRILNLSNNQITHKGGHDIAMALKRNKTLARLDLQWNNIGAMGGKAILGALKTNKYIVSVELTGNNIPSDTLKAITTSVQRNVDYHTIFDEQQSMAKSIHKKLQYLEHEKSCEVDSLVDQLQREKDLHKSLTETTHERFQHMKHAMEEMKENNKKLREDLMDAEKNMKAGKDQTTELKIQLIEQEKVFEVKSSKYAADIKALEGKLHEQQNFVKEKEKDVCSMQTNIKNLQVKVTDLQDEVDLGTKRLNNAKQKFHEEVAQLGERHVHQIEHQNSILEKQIHALNEKLYQSQSEKEKLSEDMAALKRKFLAETMKQEESLVAQRTKWNQEEMLKSKQYEDRIDTLLKDKESLQNKMSDLSLTSSQSESQLTYCRKELELLKQQSEQQQQLLNQRNREYSNEISRLNMQLDNEKRVSKERKDKLDSIENRNQDLQNQMQQLQTGKDNEIKSLCDILKAKEEESKKNREEELRRVAVLESAFHSYLNSLRCHK